MTSYKLEYTKLFLKQLRKLEKSAGDAILDSIEKILQMPYVGSLLVYSDEKCLKWRTGSYRIIYKIKEKEKKVILLVVAHRKKIYKRYKF